LSGESTQVRPATDADDPFLRRVYAAARAEEVAAFGWPDAQVAAFLRQQFDAQRAHYRAAYPDAVEGLVEVDGEPVGRLYARHSAGALVVLDLALLPEHRGRGVGTALLRSLQADAAAFGVPLRLHVDHTNPARRLYERVGLRPVADDGIRLELEWRRPAEGDWAAAVGTTVTLLDEGVAVPLELVDCTPGPGGGEFEQFAVLLRGPSHAPVVQGTYRLEHPTLGTLDVFCVPVARTTDHVELSVSFSQLRTTREEVTDGALPR
jgi:ribosomal protein S18 acetylase RimI-like enzyme